MIQSFSFTKMNVGFIATVLKTLSINTALDIILKQNRIPKRNQYPDKNDPLLKISYHQKV